MSRYTTPDTMVRLDKLEKAVRQLEVSPRINGLDNLVVMNSENSAPVFYVAAGEGGFPLPSCTWQPDYEFSGMDSQGRRTTTDTVVFHTMYTCVLPLMTPNVHYAFSPFITGATQGQMQFRARALDDRSDGGVHDVGGVITFDNSYPNVQTGTLVIPSTILDTPYEDVVGSIIFLWVEAKISGGAGTLALAPVEPAYCVP